MNATITIRPRLDLTNIPERRRTYHPLGTFFNPFLYVDVEVETNEKRYERKGAYGGAEWLDGCGVVAGFPEEFLMDFAPPAGGLESREAGAYRVSVTVLEPGFATRGAFRFGRDVVAVLREPP